MITYLERTHASLSHKILCSFIALTFLSSVILPPGIASAQFVPATVLDLPVPGTMVPPSPGFMPALMTGVTIHPDNPLRFDFIMDRGQSDLSGEPLKEEYKKMIKYFMASLTVPEDELWVNLSPYEKDRMIAEGLGKTEMGRDMLAQDYLLKQLTASLMYPEKELGKEFWNKVYKQAREKFGTTEIPVNTFNKVWIVPDEALVYEQGPSAFVIKSRLKVMLEEDYDALRSNAESRADVGSDEAARDEAHAQLKSLVSGSQAKETRDGFNSPEVTQVIREVVIPAIEAEVNEGKNFANLRQIYSALILATWYKQRLKDSLLGKVYVNQNKTKGIDTQDKEINRKIYDQYIESFKKGVYNFIKEDVDPATQEIIPRKYFSGGMKWGLGLKILGTFALGTLLGFGSLAPANAQDLVAAATQGDKESVIAEFVDNANQEDIGPAIVVREGAQPLLAQNNQPSSEPLKKEQSISKDNKPGDFQGAARILMVPSFEEELVLDPREVSKVDAWIREQSPEEQGLLNEGFALFRQQNPHAKSVVIHRIKVSANGKKDVSFKFIPVVRSGDSQVPVKESQPDAVQNFFDMQKALRDQITRELNIPDARARTKLQEAFNYLIDRMVSSGDQWRDEEITSVRRYIDRSYELGLFDGNVDLLVNYFTITEDQQRQEEIIFRLLATVPNMYDLVWAYIRISDLTDTSRWPVAAQIREEIVYPLLFRGGLTDSLYALEFLTEGVHPQIVRDEAQKQLAEFHRADKKIKTWATVGGGLVGFIVMVYFFKWLVLVKDKIQLSRKNFAILLAIAASFLANAPADAAAGLQEELQPLYKAAREQNIDPAQIAPSTLSPEDQFRQIQQILRETLEIKTPAVQVSAGEVDSTGVTIGQNVIIENLTSYPITLAELINLKDLQTGQPVVTIGPDGKPFLENIRVTFINEGDPVPETASSPVQDGQKNLVVRALKGAGTTIATLAVVFCLGCGDMPSYRPPPGVIAEGPTATGQYGNVTEFWVEGRFDLSAYEGLRLTFPPEQAGVKFYLQLLPRGFSPNTSIGLSRTFFVVPQSGIIDIPLNNVPSDFFSIHPYYLASIQRIIVHSGEGDVYDIYHPLDQGAGDIAIFESIIGVPSPAAGSVAQRELTYAGQGTDKASSPMMEVTDRQATEEVGSPTPEVFFEQLLDELIHRSDAGSENPQTPLRILVPAPQTVADREIWSSHGFTEKSSAQDRARERVLELFSTGKVRSNIVIPDVPYGQFSHAKQEVVLTLTGPVEMFGKTVQQIHLYRPGGLVTKTQKEALKNPQDEAQRQILKDVLSQFVVIGILPLSIATQSDLYQVLAALPVAEQERMSYAQYFVTEQEYMSVSKPQVPAIYRIEAVVGKKQEIEVREDGPESIRQKIAERNQKIIAETFPKVGATGYIVPQPLFDTLTFTFLTSRKTGAQRYNDLAKYVSRHKEKGAGSGNLEKMFGENPDPSLRKAVEEFLGSLDRFTPLIPEKALGESASVDAVYLSRVAWRDLVRTLPADQQMMVWIAGHNRTERFYKILRKYKEWMLSPVTVEPFVVPQQFSLEDREQIGGLLKNLRRDARVPAGTSKKELKAEVIPLPLFKERLHKALGFDTDASSRAINKLLVGQEDATVPFVILKFLFKQRMSEVYKSFLKKARKDFYAHIIGRKEMAEGPAAAAVYQRKIDEALEEENNIIKKWYTIITTSSPLQAQTSDKGPVVKGGIDLNPALLDLQIKRDGNGVPLPLPMQPIQDMHIEGFLPVIINIVPITNLPLLLGLDLPAQEEKPVQLTYQQLSLGLTQNKERFYGRDLEEIFAPAI